MQNVNVLVPDNIVEEFFWPQEVTPVSDAPPWFKGFFSWHDKRLPLICFERLNNGFEDELDKPYDAEEEAVSTVAVMVGTVNRKYLPYYAVNVTAESRLVDLNNGRIIVDENKSIKRAEACWTVADNQEVMIPKTEWIEQHLLAFLLRPNSR